MTIQPQERPGDEPVAGWKRQLAELIASAPLNLVSRADRRDVERIHVDECVAVGQALEIRPDSRWLDLGTGGGLPGLVLAAMYPRSRWTLLDARRKKVVAVASFAAALGLANVTTVHARVGVDDDPAPAFDGVIARAVGSAARTLVLSRGFVASGEIVAIRGPAARAEAADLRPLCSRLGCRIAGVDRVDGTMRPTWLVRIRAEGPPPPGLARIRRELLVRTGGSPSSRQ